MEEEEEGQIQKENNTGFCLEIMSFTERGKLVSEDTGRWGNHFGNLWFEVRMKHPRREGYYV